MVVVLVPCERAADLGPEGQPLLPVLPGRVVGAVLLGLVLLPQSQRVLPLHAVRQPTCSTALFSTGSQPTVYTPWVHVVHSKRAGTGDRTRAPKLLTACGHPGTSHSQFQTLECTFQ